jgi:hypothetical protein
MSDPKNPQYVTMDQLIQVITQVLGNQAAAVSPKAGKAKARKPNPHKGLSRLTPEQQTLQQTIFEATRDGQGNYREECRKHGVPTGKVLRELPYVHPKIN